MNIFEALEAISGGPCGKPGDAPHPRMNQRLVFLSRHAEIRADVEGQVMQHRRRIHEGAETGEELSAAIMRYGWYDASKILLDLIVTVPVDQGSFRALLEHVLELFNPRTPGTQVSLFLTLLYKYVDQYDMDAGILACLNRSKGCFSPLEYLNFIGICGQAKSSFCASQEEADELLSLDMIRAGMARYPIMVPRVREALWRLVRSQGYRADGWVV